MANGHEEATKSPVNLRDYLSVFSRRIWYIVVPFVLVTLVGGALGFLLPAEFKAEVKLKVNDVSSLDALFKKTSVSIPHKPLLASMGEEIKSRSFLEEPIRRCRINEGYNVDDPRQFNLLLTQIITKNLVVALRPMKQGPDIIAFTYQGRDRHKVGEFVTAVADKYIEHFYEQFRNMLFSINDQQRKKVEDARKAFERANEEMRTFLNNNPEVIGDTTLTQKRAAALRIEEQLREKSAALKGAQEEHDTVKGALRMTHKFVPGTSTRGRNPIWEEQLKVVQAKRTALANLREVFTEVWPQVATAKKELEVEEKKLEEIEDTITNQTLEVPNEVYKTLEAQEAALNAKVAGLEAEVQAITAERDRIRSGDSDIARLQPQYGEIRLRVDDAERTFLNAKAELDLTEGTLERFKTSTEGTGFFVKIAVPLINEADSWDPVFPSVGLFLGIGAFVGLLLGCGLAFLVEFTSQSFVTVGQVRRTLPVQILGQVAVIESSRELRARLTRRLMVAAAALALIGVVAFAHACYFNKGMQHQLPTWLFDVMKRLYGSR